MSSSGTSSRCAAEGRLDGVLLDDAVIGCYAAAAATRRIGMALDDDGPPWVA